MSAQTINLFLNAVEPTGRDTQPQTLPQLTLPEQLRWLADHVEGMTEIDVIEKIAINCFGTGPDSVFGILTKNYTPNVGGNLEQVLVSKGLEGDVDLIVQVSGRTNVGKTYAAFVCQEALLKAGFNKVPVVNPEGDIVKFNTPEVRDAARTKVEAVNVLVLDTNRHLNASLPELGKLRVMLQP